MGNRDALEQLEAAKQECVRLERELAGAQVAIEKAREALKWGSIPLGMSLWRLLETVITNATRELKSVDTSALAAHDAETRRQALEEAAAIAESDQFYDDRGDVLSSDEVSYNAARKEAANAIRALTENGTARG